MKLVIKQMRKNSLGSGESSESRQIAGGSPLFAADCVLEVNNPSRLLSSAAQRPTGVSVRHSVSHTVTGIPANVIFQLRSQLEAERHGRIIMERALAEMRNAASQLQQRIEALSARRERQERSEAESVQDLRAKLAERLSRIHELERLLSTAETIRKQQLARLERVDRNMESVERRTADQRLEFEQTLLSLQQSLTSTAQALAESKSDNELLAREVYSLKVALNELTVSHAKSESDDLRAASAQGALSMMHPENDGLVQPDAVPPGAVAVDEVCRIQNENDLMRAELDAVRSAALAEKLTSQDYVQSLKEQLHNLRLLCDGRDELIMRAEDMIITMQAESAAVATLIDVVQASHFWKIKRIFRKMLARSFRRK